MNLIEAVPELLETALIPFDFKSLRHGAARRRVRARA